MHFQLIIVSILCSNEIIYLCFHHGQAVQILQVVLSLLETQVVLSHQAVQQVLMALWVQMVLFHLVTLEIQQILSVLEIQLVLFHLSAQFHPELQLDQVIQEILYFLIAQMGQLVLLILSHQPNLFHQVDLLGLPIQGSPFHQFLLVSQVGH